MKVKASQNMNEFIDDFVNGYVKDFTNIFQEEIQSEIDGIYKEFAEKQKLRLQSMYAIAVNNFYEDYTPMFYNRHYSLYNMLQIETYDGGASWSYDEQKITPMRKGGTGLYDLVFKQGYHGGASGTDRRGETKTTPHYRTPVRRPNAFRRWSYEAQQSASPYDEAQSAFFDADAEGGIFDVEFAKLTTDAVDRALSRVRKKMDEIWGD